MYNNIHINPILQHSNNSNSTVIIIIMIIQNMALLERVRDQPWTPSHHAATWKNTTCKPHLNQGCCPYAVFLPLLC